MVVVARCCGIVGIYRAHTSLKHLKTIDSIDKSSLLSFLLKHHSHIKRNQVVNLRLPHPHFISEYFTTYFQRYACLAASFLLAGEYGFALLHLRSEMYSDKQQMSYWQ